MPAMLHPGAFLSGSRANRHEVDKRIKECNSAWSALLGFWFSSGPRPVKGLLAITVLYSKLLSGLEALTLTTSECLRLTRAMNGKLRAMLLGKAHLQRGDAHKTMKTNQLWRLWRAAPPAIELTVRRLHVIQALAREPLNNHHLLCVFFGEFAFEADAPRRPGPVLSEDGSAVSTAHPWAKQMRDDIDSLASLDGGSFVEMWEKAGKSIKALFV